MIYIIDDDISVSRSFRILLKSYGYESRTYDSVIDFLNLCEPVETDLIILDMHMQGLNGCDLLKQLNKEKLRMQVIVVTAYDSKTARDCAHKYGVIAFLRKPVDGDALLDLVNFNYKAISDKH